MATEGEMLEYSQAKESMLKKAFGDSHSALQQLEKDLEKANWESYNFKTKQQAPIFKQRNELLKKMPAFWLQAMTNDPTASNLIDAVDLDALKYLVDLEITHDAADARNVSFSFHFSKDNSYFSDSVLTKKFSVKPGTDSYDLDVDLVTEPVSISWTSPDWNLAKKKPRINVAEMEEFDDFGGSLGSFFNWFGEKEDKLGVGDTLVELHAHAVEAYAGVLEQHDNDADDDESDEESDEDPNAVVDLGDESDEEDRPRKKKAKTT